MVEYRPISNKNYLPRVNHASLTFRRAYKRAHFENIDSVGREFAQVVCTLCGTNFASGLTRNFEPIFESGNTRKRNICAYIIRKYRGII